MHKGEVSVFFTFYKVNVTVAYFLDPYILTTALNSLFIAEQGSWIIYFKQRFITDKHSNECTPNFKLKLALYALCYNKQA